MLRLRADRSTTELRRLNGDFWYAESQTAEVILVRGDD
jgi:hypothetical protein